MEGNRAGALGGAERGLWHRGSWLWFGALLFTCTFACAGESSPTGTLKLLEGRDDSTFEAVAQLSYSALLRRSGTALEVHLSTGSAVMVGVEELDAPKRVRALFLTVAHNHIDAGAAAEDVLRSRHPELADATFESLRLHLSFFSARGERRSLEISELPWSIDPEFVPFARLRSEGLSRQEYAEQLALAMVHDKALFVVERSLENEVDDANFLRGLTPLKLLPQGVSRTSYTDKFVKVVAFDAPSAEAGSERQSGLSHRNPDELRRRALFRRGASAEDLSLAHSWSLLRVAGKGEACDWMRSPGVTREAYERAIEGPSGSVFTAGNWGGACIVWGAQSGSMFIPSSFIPGVIEPRPQEEPYLLGIIQSSLYPEAARMDRSRARDYCSRTSVEEVEMLKAAWSAPTSPP